MAEMNWDVILNGIDPKWHAAFREYVRTGKGSRDFHRYLDDSPKALLALEQAAAAVAQLFVKSLAEKEKDVPRDKVTA